MCFVRARVCRCKLRCFLASWCSAFRAILLADAVGGEGAQQLGVEREGGRSKDVELCMKYQWDGPDAHTVKRNSVFRSLTYVPPPLI